MLQKFNLRNLPRSMLNAVSKSISRERSQLSSWSTMLWRLMLARNREFQR